MALRLAGLGVAAAVALHVALNKRKHEDKEKERRRRAHRSEASSGADRRAGRTDADSAREPRQQVLEVSCTSGPKEPARPPSTAKPPAKRSWPVRVATLLLRLLLSIAMALGLQVAASGGAPVQWTTVVLSSTVLFVINELGQRVSVSGGPVGWDYALGLLEWKVGVLPCFRAVAVLSSESLAYPVCHVPAALHPAGPAICQTKAAAAGQRPRTRTRASQAVRLHRTLDQGVYIGSWEHHDGQERHGNVLVWGPCIIFKGGGRHLPP